MDEFVITIRRYFITDLESNIKQITNMYKEEIQELNNLTSYMNVIYNGVADWKSNDWRPFTQYVFDTQGGEMQWAPNRGWYATWKLEKYNMCEPMIREGDLRKNYITDWSIKNMGEQIVVYTQIPEYAKYHQLGIPPPNWNNKIPFLKRQFFYITTNLIRNAGYNIGKRVFRKFINRLKRRVI